MDWTFDEYVRDMKRYEIADRDLGPYEAYFVSMIKDYAQKFRLKWQWKNDGKLFAHGEYVGDAFQEELIEAGFSDFYKDTYGQRPHLPMWYYVAVLGLPQREDTVRTFCADPLGDACREAERERERGW